MRRLASLLLLALTVVALVGVPAAAHGGRDHDRGRSTRPPSFSVLVGSARQGGTMLIAAKVHPPRRFRPWRVSEKDELSATAVVHFASGDVEVTLAPRAARTRFKSWYRGVGYPGHRFLKARGRSIWGRPFWSPRSWKRAWTVFAKVPVGAAEQVGRVAVDVTVTFGDTTATVTTYGKVKAAKPAPTPEPSPSPVAAGRSR